MRHIAIGMGVALIIVLVFSLSRGSFSALAQSGGSYDLTWNTLDNGGGQSSGGAYTLSGSIGQPDAAGSNGGTYSLGGGIWGGSGNSLQSSVFLPLILR